MFSIDDWARVWEEFYALKSQLDAKNAELVEIKKNLRTQGIATPRPAPPRPVPPPEGI